MIAVFEAIKGIDRVDGENLIISDGGGTRGHKKVKKIKVQKY